MIRIRKFFFIGLVLLYTITLSHAITISIAPIPYLSEQPGTRVVKTINFQERLQEELMKSFKWDFIDIKLLDPAEKTPEDFLHAAEICERLGLDYLLYGYILQEKTLHEERKTSIHGEIKLFCKERNIIQTFYSSDNPDQQERLLHDLAFKIEAYFLTIFKPMNSQIEKESPEEGIISFLLQIGCLLSCTPGIYEQLGRLNIDPEITDPVVASFTVENAVKIYWDADENADSCILYRCPDTNTDNLKIIYQGKDLEFLDTDCVPEGRYLYALSKIRGQTEFGPSDLVPGVCGSIVKDFYEPNDVKLMSTWLEYDLEANIYYYRDTQGNIIEDVDLYYIDVPPRRIANIVVTQINLMTPDTFLYFYQETEMPFQIINNQDIPIENYSYKTSRFYFKIYPNPTEFLNDVDEAGGTMVGYRISLHMITSL